MKHAGRPSIFAASSVMHETVAPEGAGVGVATGAGVEVGTPIVTDIATKSLFVTPAEN